MSKNQMSEWVGVVVRTYSRWEKNESKPIDDNLKDLAERTKVPYEVLFRLNQGYPTLYNIVTRRYAQCPFEKDYVNRKILQEELFDTDEQGYISSISSERDINMVLDSLFPVYLNSDKVSSEVMRHTFKIFPEMNLIIKDPIGFYSGHVICFPLTLEKYEYLRANKTSEAFLTPEDIIQPPWNEPVALHIFAFFSRLI